MFESQASTVKWQACPMFSNSNLKRLVNGTFFYFFAYFRYPQQLEILALKCLKLPGSYKKIEGRKATVK